jgi:Family of unknown function (DUF5996)
MPNTSNTEAWPSLPLEAWSDTCATLHMWTQIVGKIRLAQSPGGHEGPSAAEPQPK